VGSYADLPRCGMPVSRLSRGGRITKATCRNPVRPGELRCWVHADLFKWAASERKIRERRRQKLRAKNRGWSVEKLAALGEDRQLDLLAWGDAYDGAFARLVRALLDEQVDDRDLMPTLPPLDAGRAAWDRYDLEWDAYERRAEDRRRAWEHIADQAFSAAERAVLEQGWPGWGTLRRLVYERDGGICFVCDRAVPFEFFELGHLQDRVMGGSDRPDNVVVMCGTCNHLRKPLHETTDDAREWAAICRAEFRRIWSEQSNLSEAEFLAAFARLSEDERQQIVDEALSWPDQVEAELRTVRQWFDERAADEDSLA
jgi:hypothetical protein